MRRTSMAILLTLAHLLVPALAAGQAFLGKDTTSWLRELERPDEAGRRNAAYALGKLGLKGAPALPALLKHLREDTSAKVREAAAFAVGEIGARGGRTASIANDLAHALKDESPLVRRSAAFALGNLGPDAGPAAAALGAAMDDPRPEVRQNVAWALGKVGPAGVTSIRRGLRDADLLVKRDAAAALAHIDPKSVRPAIPDLLPLCNEKDTEVRKAALNVLVKVVGPEDAAAAAPLRQALKSDDAEVRTNAALVLSNIGGKDAAAAVPVLIDSLKNGDVTLRRQAAAAFRNIGPDAKAAIPDLINALRDPDAETRTNAALALGGIGPDADAAIPALVRVIADPKEQWETRVEAAVALSRMGDVPAAVSAVPTLLQVLQDPTQDARVRERIVWSLRVHKGNLRTLPNIYPTFMKVLGEPSREDNKMLRYDCAYMLGVLQGSEVAAEAMSVLLEFLKDDTIQIFENKKSTVGGSTQESGTGKAEVKEVGKGDGRTMVIQALNQIGPARLAQRRDIIQQLQLLANNEATFIDLREGCKKLLAGVK